MEKLDITALILTYNEEKNIEECLKSIQNFVNKIIVIDSYSNDKTEEICKKYGVDFYQHKFVTHSKQLQYALDKIKFDTKWIMRVDADERISDETRNELTTLCKIHTNDDINGFVLRFKLYFLGKYLKHGGTYPIKRLSVFKNGTAYLEDKEMDEHLLLKSGKTIECKTDCFHHNAKSIYDWINKHNEYSSKETIDFLSRKTNIISEGLNKSSRRKVKMKRFYYKFPPAFRAKLYYIHRYIFKLGFLDGKPGRYYAFLQAYWYRYLVDIKIYEQSQKK